MADARPRAPTALEAAERRRDQDTISALRTSLRRTQEELLAAQDRLSAALRLRRAKPPPLDWRPVPSVHRRTVLLPALFTSDFQCGEVIRRAEIDGLNEYNKDVFAERYHAMIERTIDCATHHTGAATFPGIFYLRGGDAISGGIHDELAESDDLSAVPAVRWLMQHERAGIKRLRDRFKRVHVVSIPGNHGRTTLKRRSKGYTERSYETLLAWWLETLFEGDARVTFAAPPSGDAYFEMQGWHFLMSHGDRMGSRGGQGFVGPAATIARGHKKLFDNWALTGRPVDVILTGHLHTSLQLERGFANGALAGYSEYARDLRATPDAAKQWLLFVHEKRGVSQAFELQLSERPARDLVAAAGVSG